MTIKTRKILSLMASASSLVGFSGVLIAATPADNSRQNTRDRSDNEITADQQKMNQSDTDITARIRRELVKDSNLSTYAQNIKIITIDGKVTLKGPVRSTDEKSNVEQKASAVVGPQNILDELTVTAENK